MASFSIAMTGLEANSAALNTIGNNLANLNTTAYKKQTTTFEDLFYQQVGTAGSGDPLLAGVGTKVSGTASSFAQGSLVTTSNSTDMALQGDGFFLVQNGKQTELTRAGNFQISSTGELTTVDGLQVMGYPTTNGAVDLNAPLSTIKLPVGTDQAAQATSNLQATVNLDATTAVGGNFSTSMQIYDSLGQAHTVGIAYTKTAANTWNYNVTLPSGDATGAAGANTGTLTFDTSGKLISPTSNTQNVTFSGLADGAADLNFNLNLFDSSGNPVVGQLASTSTASATMQDGYAAGSYQGFTVDAQGVVAATFSNGHTADVGQVAVGTVINQQGLMRMGDNNYMATAASGPATIGTAGSGGRGTIEDEALEQSNVDISTEFADLIVAQRAFEANSKTITTFDTVTQDTIGMIR